MTDDPDIERLTLAAVVSGLAIGVGVSVAALADQPWLVVGCLSVGVAAAAAAVWQDRKITARTTEVEQ